MLACYPLNQNHFFLYLFPLQRDPFFFLILESGQSLYCIVAREFIIFCRGEMLECQVWSLQAWPWLSLIIFKCKCIKYNHVWSILNLHYRQSHDGLLGTISDNTAGVVTRRGGFRRLEQNMYLMPVVVEDGGYPIRSSTGTVSVRVCTCDIDGSLLSCNAEAVFFPMGLSTGALMAILLCIVILLGELDKFASNRILASHRNMHFIIYCDK